MINWIKKKLGIHVHTWGRWCIKEQKCIEYLNEYLDSPNFQRRFIKLIQSRTCEECGFVERKNIPT